MLVLERFFSFGCFSLNESLETSSGLAVLDLRADGGWNFPVRGGVSGVSGRLKSLSKMLKFVEDELELEAAELWSNDGRFGVSLARDLNLKLLLEW